MIQYNIIIFVVHIERLKSNTSVKIFISSSINEPYTLFRRFFIVYGSLTELDITIFTEVLDLSLLYSIDNVSLRKS